MGASCDDTAIPEGNDKKEMEKWVPQIFAL